MLRGKKILLGVSGGIAAYKIPLLVRLLKKEGMEVRVVMTPSAKEFVTPQTLAVLSEYPVWTDFFSGGYVWNNHVHLGEWADLMVVAPATANTIAKMAHGICDNLLLTVYYSARCPVMVFPAMDLEMYAHPTVKETINRLKEKHVTVVPAESGPLASGLTGEGRMPEPEAIFRKIITKLACGGPMEGKKVLVNAGPTHEPIDPVRYIGNQSSGKMGLAIAEAFALKGAQVTLVSGPVTLIPKTENIHIIKTQTALQMRDAMLSAFTDADITVCTAAVADFRPSKPSENKIKKSEKGTFSLELALNPDILEELGKMKKKDQVLVGFALETQNELEYGMEKLKRKNADFMVVNRAVQEGGCVFGSDWNEATIISKDGKNITFGRLLKEELAMKISDIVQDYLK
ncbi:MAG: bifunctional phosphopantothenoylcysteine decarboxylase/phosphopantothenate--cysteine ligase CoaBC [Bacteroidia bacterium]|nr:bifunctional phosphopantothenoylcysteine decarboxylase/phosphopantothenate--cysteine ligase CoaBC [Bacteroidia bacterium]